MVLIEPALEEDLATRLWWLANVEGRIRQWPRLRRSNGLPFPLTWRTTESDLKQPTEAVSCLL